MIMLPPETEQLVRLVAQRSGKSPEQVVRQAVEAEARLAGVVILEAQKLRQDINPDRVREIAGRIAAKPLRDARTPKEIRDQAWGDPG
jgi:antitoxin VapB